MLYIHESNIKNKIDSNYKNLSDELSRFYNEEYLPFRESIQTLRFADGDNDSFREATELINGYYDTAFAFQQEYNIDTRSKFLSTIYEELSVYLFRDHEAIVNGSFDVFNKGIYAGMKFVDGEDISIVTKDVDFCIGRRINITIDDSAPTYLILPVVCVEVKTYLDATMFGEVKSSSQAIRSATPNSKTYVLMGHKELADDHIIAARQDSALTEMFVLRKDASSPIEAEVLYEYWDEITTALDGIFEPVAIETPGRLLFPSNRQQQMTLFDD
ncbi:MAG: Bpu10I family restriction endonuclease [Mogibacterium sp.]|nr:Bpu10I family restriction endonuclease [Mogibacterium sp.]